MLGSLIENLIEGRPVSVEELNRYGAVKKTVQKGHVVVKGGSRVKDVVVLIRGEVYVSRYSTKGDRIISNQMENTQIFCLLEKIKNMDEVLSDVVALSTCEILKVSATAFVNMLDTDRTLAKLSFLYITDLCLSMIDYSMKQSSMKPHENLLMYFYFNAEKRKLPWEITMNKNYMADLFRMNIRSLYRYLKKWEDEGLIERKGQNIVITEENYIELKKKIVKIRL